MKFLYLLALLPAVLAHEGDHPESTTGLLGDAAVIKNQPNVTYSAVFADEGKIQGKILFHPGAGGEGVHLVVDLKNIPAGTGPFGYHVHDQPVAEGGNCSSTKAHLDPYQRGQVVPCDPEHPETCEVGDLSGKHGKIPSNVTTFTDDYTDLYLSLRSPSGAFIGNRSIVIHDATTARIACVNIALASHGDDDSHDDDDDHHGPKPNATTTITPPKPTQSNDGENGDGGDDESGAGKVAGSVLFAAVGAVAAMLL